MTQAFRLGITVLTALLSAASVQSFSQNVNSEGASPIQLSYGDVLQSDYKNSNTRSINTDVAGRKQLAISHNWQYWCDMCACGFNKLKSYNEHVVGRRHNAVLVEADSLWEDYQVSSPSFYDSSVTRDVVTRAWSLDLFMDGLQARSRSSKKHFLAADSALGKGQLDPTLMLCDLTPDKKAALWRYLHSGAIPDLSFMVAALPPRYARVKEILESVETFYHVERLMKRSTTDGKKAVKVSHIYDVGCGHGLVGMLCAASFTHIHVHSIDRAPRESFEAQRAAFESTGTPLDNLTFEAGDLTILHDRKQDGDDQHSMLLCVHGCKSLTHESIELAERNKWAWLSLPCCLQSENHLDAATTLKVSDEIRFAMLCGAIAATYQAETVSSIDSRITGRGIVLASPGKS